MGIGNSSSFLDISPVLVTLAALQPIWLSTIHISFSLFHSFSIDLHLFHIIPHSHFFPFIFLLLLFLFTVPLSHIIFSLITSLCLTCSFLYSYLLFSPYSLIYFNSLICSTFILFLFFSLFSFKFLSYHLSSICTFSLLFSIISAFIYSSVSILKL
ncbi:unnamed protein product [Acanthosepion pharaonis]|uniref:Uncharacterized protein n=1 Tax=Acanthosepion pharaonis TaxID=158019 RepID=A0A812EF09_ACAPH|nr:unnamed protein product [Sepia pharaonis]